MLFGYNCFIKGQVMTIILLYTIYCYNYNIIVLSFKFPRFHGQFLVVTVVLLGACPWPDPAGKGPRSPAGRFKNQPQKMKIPSGI